MLLASVLALLGGVVLLGKTLTPFYIAFALVYLLNPAVSWVAARRFRDTPVGRLAGIVTVYAAFALGLWFVGLFVLPQLYQEFARLAQILPAQVLHFERDVMPGLVITWQGQLDTYNVPFDIKKTLQEGVTSGFDTVNSHVMELAKRARDLIAGVFSTILLLVLVFMLTGFLLYDLPRLQRWLGRLLPDRYRAATMSLMADIDRGLAGAVRGQIGVCVVNGVLTTVGLMVIGVKFAVTLGVLAGFFSLIPVFGTLFSTVPIVLVALTNSLLTGLLALIWILLIHLIEANLLNPNIIGHNAELHPALVVLALLVGEHYGGAVGLLVAVPLATVIRAILTYTLGRLLIQPDTIPDAEAPAHTLVAGVPPSSPSSPLEELRDGQVQPG
ncbi:MAG: AI-2E family transporter [Candidatus Sericytochromatia bacterium]|nr:AI-2E family transporter [Candidatus Sericytochromatia bacterium]